MGRHLGQRVWGWLKRVVGGRQGESAAVPVTEDREAVSQEVLEFLMAVLKAEIEDGEKGVFRVLRSRLGLLDQRFLTVMVAWALSTLEEADGETAEGIAGLIGNICVRISDFPLGDRGMNLEIAIAGYQQVVLKVRSPETHREKWAQTQNNLAIAFRNRIRGDRAENLEQSIHAYQQALLVRTREDFPVDWAMTQNNLAAALMERIRGDRAANLEQSIHAFQQALLVYTRENFPVQWATAQNNLANALRERIRGDRAENLEESIHAYQQALRVYTREDFPVQWATTQNNLATALSDRIRGDHAENFQRAVQGYRNALEIRSPESFPLECLNTGRNLGQAAFKEGQWELALEGYGVAMAAIEQSRSWSVTEERRQEVLSQSIGVYENAIHCHVQRGHLSQALEIVERVRSKGLVELMGTGDLYQSGEVPAPIREILHRLDATQQQLQTATQHQLVTTGPNRSRVATAASEQVQALEAERTVLRNQLARLDPIASGFRDVQPLTLGEMQTLVDHPTTALLSLYITDNETHIFILRQTDPDLFTIPGQGFKELNGWLVEKWLQPYAERSTKEWAEQMPKVLAELSDRLQLNDLIQQHLTDITDLILIPHLLLHQIPFAALPLPNDQLLGDRFTLRYAPGCQVLKICRDRQDTTPTPTPTYGIVENATNDLPCSAYEGQQLAQTLGVPSDRHLRGNAATAIAYRQLLQTCTSIVSTHHAQHRLDNPLESHLLLGNGDRITLGQLLLPTWRFPDLDEIFLSCCETSFTFTGKPIDDVLTLGTGFLCAGANSIIGTLWSVDDLATALFSLHYHHHRQTGSDRPTALRQAQTHLRHLTGQTFQKKYAPALKQHLEAEFDRLCDLLDQAETAGDSDRITALDSAAAKTEKILANLETYSQQVHPFAHPFYWAGFTCQGLR